MYVRHPVTADTAALFERRVRALNITVEAYWRDPGPTARPVPEFADDFCPTDRRLGVIELRLRRMTHWLLAGPGDADACWLPIFNKTGIFAQLSLLTRLNYHAAVVMPVPDGAIMRLIYRPSYAWSAARLTAEATRRPRLFRTLLAGVVKQPLHEFVDILLPLYCDRVVELIPPLV